MVRLGKCHINGIGGLRKNYKLGRALVVTAVELKDYRDREAKEYLQSLVEREYVTNFTGGMLG